MTNFPKILPMYTLSTAHECLCIYIYVYSEMLLAIVQFSSADWL